MHVRERRSGDCLSAGCDGEFRYESKNAEAMIAEQKSSYGHNPESGQFSHSSLELQPEDRGELNGSR